MPLTIENGLQVAGANSYLSRTDYINRAATVGVVIADDDNADYELIKAAQYIGQHEANLKGTKASRGQAMAYPRYGAVISGWSWSGNEIPRQVADCQFEYAIEINNGTDLWNRPVNPARAIKRNRVEGAIDVEYEPSGAVKPVKSSAGDAFLACLLKSNGGLMSFDIIRA